MKNIKYLSLVALVVMGAIFASCENIEQNVVPVDPVDPVSKDNIVVCKFTVRLGTGGTKALIIDDVNHKGVKTFAENDQIAVIYKNTSDNTVTALSDALPEGVYGDNTTFTVTLINPKPSTPVRCIYPATMLATSVATDSDVDAPANINYAALEDNQDGTLATLGSNFDLAIFDGTLTGEGALPAGEASLTNQLAILAITLKDNSTLSEITSSITGMTLSDGTNNYVITRSAGVGPIYVAIRPTSSASLFITATNGTDYYTKSLNNKSYVVNNGYSVSWKMTNAGHALGGQFSVSSTTKVKFSQGNLQATYDGSVWTWTLAINQWDHIGSAAGNTSINGNGTVSTNNVTVDLFGWVGASNVTWNGTVGTTLNAAMHGISNSRLTLSNDTYGTSDTESLKRDWGTVIGTGWRTLTKDEWSYLFGTRQSGSSVNGVSDARYTYATVHSVHGVILFPDNVTIEHSEIDSWGSINGLSSWATVPTNDQWTALAAKGCVFLPAAGYRSMATVNNVSVGGYYWSASSYAGNANKAYSVFLKANNQGFDTPDDRFFGFSVRLVRDVE